MNPPDREERQVPSTVPREEELEPGHPVHAWSGGRNSSIPASRGEGWQAGSLGWGQGCPLSPQFPPPRST